MENPAGQTHPESLYLSRERYLRFSRICRTLEEPAIEIEDVIPSWSTVFQIFRIYGTDLHPLYPVVHKTTFSREFLARADKRDREFRSLVLGLSELPFGVISPSIPVADMMLLHDSA
jgi:hypothetical protein